MAIAVGRACGVSQSGVLVASTGVIGHFLPMEKIYAAVPRLTGAVSSSKRAGRSFARAIMTTDTRIKEAAVSVNTERGAFVVGGCAKGSGMIHPSMATMLAFITTDAAVSERALATVVRRVVDWTFNNLTVDGDTSTNDMMLVCANGVSGTRLKAQGDLALFEKALFTVCNRLCAQIAEDGEGATKRIEVNVVGGRTYHDSRRAAKAIAGSNLVKTAIFGNDPNWGRILCAVGYSGARFSKGVLEVSINGISVCKALQPVPFAKTAMQRALRKKVVRIRVNLGLGDARAVAHTCDLTYDYIRINAEYHT